VFGTVITFIGFIYRLYDGTMLAKFSVGCTFLDCAMFLVGSLYFVAGSYPEQSSNSSSTGDLEAPQVELKTENVSTTTTTTNPLTEPLNH